MATRTSPRGRRARASATVLVLACGLAAAGGTTASAADPGCGHELPPLGASEAAEAYVAVVNASGPAWGALSDRLEQQDFVMYLEDLQLQVDADAPFVHAVRAIDFPGPARPAATAFVLAVMKHDRFLVQTVQAGAFGPSFQAVDDAVNAQRAQRSSELRDALGLDGSTCTLNRP